MKKKIEKKIGDLTLRELVVSPDKIIRAFCNIFCYYDSCTCCPMLSDNDTCIFDDLHNKTDMMEQVIEVEEK